MTEMEEFLDRVDEYLAIYHSWRYGQTCFNVLCRDYPELAEEIRGTELDPFFDDRRLPAFVEWLGARWAATIS